MKKSSDRVLTSHAGSLPRPDDLIADNAQREAGKVDETAFQKQLAQSVADVVRRQVAAGISVPGDGEYGKSRVGREPARHQGQRAWGKPGA